MRIWLRRFFVYSFVFQFLNFHAYGMHGSDDDSSDVEMGSASGSTPVLTGNPAESMKVDEAPKKVKFKQTLLSNFLSPKDSSSSSVNNRKRCNSQIENDVSETPPANSSTTSREDEKREKSPSKKRRKSNPASENGGKRGKKASSTDTQQRGDTSSAKKQSEDSQSASSSRSDDTKKTDKLNVYLFRDLMDGDRQEFEETLKSEKGKSQASVIASAQGRIPDDDPTLTKIIEDHPYVIHALPFLNSISWKLIGKPHRFPYSKFIKFQYYRMPNADEIFVFQESGASELNWVAKLQDQHRKNREHEQTGNPLFERIDLYQPKGAFIIVKTLEASTQKSLFFALTFGTGRFLINKELCESQFGMRYAYNTLSSDPSLKATSRGELDLDKKKVRIERVKTKGKLSLKERIGNILPQSITVSNERKSLCSVVGERLLTLGMLDYKIIGASLKELFNVYSGEAYRKEYAYIDRFMLVRRGDTYNQIFKAVLTSGNFDVDWPLSIENIHSVDETDGYTLSSTLKVETNYSPLEAFYTNFEDFERDLRLFITSSNENKKAWGSKKSKMELLKSLKIKCTSHGAELFSYPVHKLISSVFSVSDTTYWIEGGDIYEIDPDFVTMINNRLDRFFISRDSEAYRERFGFIDFDAFKDEDRDERGFSETEYNKRVAGFNPGKIILVDRKTPSVKDKGCSQSKTEPCDWFIKTDTFIHVKRWSGGSSSVAYLIEQAISSTVSLRNDKDQYAQKVSRLVPMQVTSLRAGEFNVILALIDRRKDFTPSKLPINSKISLFRGLDELADIYDIKASIIHIQDLSTPPPSKQSKKSTKVSTQFTENTAVASSSSSVASVPELLDEEDDDPAEDEIEDEEDDPAALEKEEQQRQIQQLMEYEYSSTDIENVIQVSLGSQRFSQSQGDFETFRIPGNWEALNFHEWDGRYIMPPITAHVSGDEEDKQKPVDMAIGLLTVFLNHKKKSIASINKILIPFNPGGHWVTLQITLEEGQISVDYIDSLCDPEIDGMKKEVLQDSIGKPLEKFFRKHFPDKRFKFDLTKFRIQSDKKACGAMVAANILDLFEEKEKLTSRKLDKEETWSLRISQKEELEKNGKNLDI